MTLENQPLISRPRSVQHEREQQWRRELLGLGFMALSPVGSAVQALLVRIGHAHWTTFEMVFSRGVVQMTAALLLFFLTAPEDVKQNGGLFGPRDQRRLLMQRGLAGCAGSVFLYTSLKLLPLGEATVVFFTAPIFTALLAACWLGERIGLFEVAAALASLFGVFLISQSPQPAADSLMIAGIDRRLLGICAGLSGAMCAAVAYVTIRRIGNGAHFLVNVFYFALFTTAVGGVATVLEKANQSGGRAGASGLLLLLAIGITGFLGQSLLTIGLQLSQAGRGVIMRYIEVPLAFVLGVALLGEVPTIKSVAGSALIIASALALALRVWVAQ